jgi:hypothetical protein
MIGNRQAATLWQRLLRLLTEFCVAAKFRDVP